MATAPVHTFVDSRPNPTTWKQIGRPPTLAPKPGETLTDVIHDPVRRNKFINDNNLLKGIRMTAAGPVYSSRELIVRPAALRSIINNQGTIETSTIEAEFTQKLMQSNYTAVSVKVSAPFVTASADYSEKTGHTNTLTHKTVLVSSRFLFPQGRIDFSPPGTGFWDDAKLSPDFMLDIIFREYGDVFCTKLQIGGTLSVHTMETYKRTLKENETEVQKDIKAGLEVTVGQWGAGVTAGHGAGESTIKTQAGRTLNVRFAVNGGDYTKITETKEWIASTNKPIYWRGIEVTEVVPIIDMLDERRRSAVRKLMTPLLGRWVDATWDKLSGRYRPREVPSGWRWLGWSADGLKALVVKPTFGPKAGRNVAASGVHENGKESNGEPSPVAPRYTALATGHGQYDMQYGRTTRLDTNFAVLRPGLLLEGRPEKITSHNDVTVFKIAPYQTTAPQDECFELYSISLKTSSEAGPRHRWVLRKNAVLFDTD